MHSDFSRSQLEWILGDDATDMNIQSLDMVLVFCKGMMPYFNAMIDSKEAARSEDRINRLVAELRNEYKKLKVTGTITDVLEKIKDIEPVKRKSNYIKDCVYMQIKVLEENGLKNKTLLKKTIAPALRRYLKGDKDPFKYGEE